MEFKLKDFHYNISDQDLLDDLKRVANSLGVTKLSSRNYSNNGGKYTSGTISLRFGSWNNALEKAGLKLVQQRNVSEKELFENIEEVWIQLGRQPVYRDMKESLTQYTTHQYIAKFGTWQKALRAFVEFINLSNEENYEVEKVEIEENIFETNQLNKIIIKHKTKRIPSERLKVQVLMRDGNKCKLCGITLTDENIHFDHVFPWSKGGETILENLQIFWAKHNLAKGNLEY